jgi:Cof subfamily protein (haloacid dehalogenase superfamily)
MTIRLVACDLDGTLVGPDLMFSPRLRGAIRRAQEAGIVVTLATGRGYPSTRPFAAALQIDAPVVCYQGAQVKEPDGSTLYESLLPREHLVPAIELCREGGWELSAYCEDEIYQTTWAYDRAFYERWFGLPVHQVHDLLESLPGDPVKYIITAPTAQEADRAERALRAAAGGQFQVMRSHAQFVEGLGRDVSKGNAVSRLAHHLGIVQGEVMAMGDSENDRSMVAWAGLGVAIGNASAVVKAAADVIAPPQAEDGAVWAIERFVLEERA